jgi:hypothetical protein
MPTWSVRAWTLLVVAAVATASGVVPAQAAIREGTGGTPGMTTITLASGIPAYETSTGLDPNTSFCVLGSSPSYSVAGSQTYSYTGPALPPPASDCLPGFPAHPSVASFYSSIIPGTQWVSVSPSASDAVLPPLSQPVFYVYDAEFDLCSTKQASLNGSMLADNAAGVYLNGHFIAATPGLLSSQSNFQVPTSFSAPPPPGLFLTGHNVIDFVVEDASPPETGLDYSVTVTAPTCGQLKICKAAGNGVAAGTPFTFAVLESYQPAASVTVPAGPAPGGYCELAGSYPLGSNVVVQEAVPAGDVVTGITVAPPAGQVGTPNLSAGTVYVRIGPGVTEVSYTDASAETGFLEICKQVFPSSTGTAPGGPFQFTVAGQTVTLPAGACSPPLQVPSGQVTVSETGGSIYACSTSPPADLVSCDFTAETATVDVAAGNVASETILTITNGPSGTAGGGTTGP